ncbi:MAG TPA: GRP family sugar transporter [Candidatus Dormibacteraeota bacterium]|jgi:drug/metabolite transporter (DMT)-like permease|nr:GRP family sugar transporter [Candidatus Dormibacteraeota bacterium]
MPISAPSASSVPAADSSRARKLQLLGILSGFTAGAWLGAAEAPTKLVTIGISPIAISLIMVIGVFLARWSLPALILGTSSVRMDVRRAPHLILWAILAGCLWAVANTLTIFAIRDIGLSIAFPLWNSNSLLGILWGFLFFNELRQAGWRRWIGVLGGALVMCAGAAILALASSAQAPAGHPLRGVAAALGAGILWGTMYIPYRKAYLTGMNPLSFVTFFTIGELGMMTALAASYTGFTPLWHELLRSRGVIFWLILGGFIWVIGDLFQQYAAKYVGISRGIPLSNSNQLWGLLWGILVFGELHGRGSSTYMQVIGGSLLMMAGVGAIAFSLATGKEQLAWKAAAHRESRRYEVAAEYIDSRMDGRQAEGEIAPSRRLLDWFLVAGATAIFIFFAAVARVPEISFRLAPAAVLSAALLALLLVCGLALWRTTRFH